MRIEETCPFPGVQPEMIFALMCNEEFQREKAERLRATGFGYVATTTAEGVDIATTRRLPTKGMPEFLKPLLPGSSMQVVETEKWNTAASPDAFVGSFDIDVDGAPVYLRGKVDLVATGGSEGKGSSLVFQGEVTATALMFKKQVAQVSSRSIIETITTEFQLLAEHTQSGTTVT